MMRGLHGVQSVQSFMWQRLVASWRLLAVLAFGILVAATLLAASPVYTRVMNDLGLQTSLKEQIGSASRNSVTRFGLPLGDPQSGKQSAALASVFSKELGWLTASEARYGALNALTLGRAGQPVATGRFRDLGALQSL